MAMRVVAGERDLEAAAEAEAVDHGDGRHFQASSRSITACARPIAVSTVARIGRAAEFVDVGAGDEAGRLGGADHEARGPLAFQRRQHRRRVPRCRSADSVLALAPGGRTAARRCRRRRG